MAALLASPFLVSLYWVYIHNILFIIAIAFDTVFSFSVAFAGTYAFVCAVERLLPARPGDRPRFWLTPAVLFGVALSFPLFLDLFVAAFLQVSLATLVPFETATFLTVASCVWVVVVVFRTVAIGRGHLWLHRLVSSLPSDADNRVLRAAVPATGLRRDVVLRRGAPGTPVFSCGVWRRCVVVPEDFETRYGEDDQYAILLHECIHIKNGDSGFLLFLSCVRAVLWFDPVSRHAVQRMRGEIELVCDWAAVRRHGLDAESYARLVVMTATGQDGPAPAFSDSYRLIARRLGVVLRDPSLSPSRLSRRMAWALSLSLTALFVVAAVVYHSQTRLLAEADAPSMNGDGSTYTVPRYGVFATFARTSITYDPQSGVVPAPPTRRTGGR